MPFLDYGKRLSLHMNFLLEKRKRLVFKQSILRPSTYLYRSRWWYIY